MTAKKAPARPKLPLDPQGIGVVDGFAHAIASLRDAHASGDLDATAAEVLAARQVLLDTEGTVWTVGLRSGHWYAFTGGKWHKHNAAPDPDTIVRPDRHRRGCHGCGAPTKKEETCSKCGAQPAPVLADESTAVVQGLADFVAKAAYPMVPERLPHPRRDPGDLDL